MAEANNEAMTTHDFVDHKQTYEGFMRVAAVGTAWVLGIVAGLAIGGTTGHWTIASFLMIVSFIATVVGALVRRWSWKPAAAVLVLELLSLLLLTR